MFSIVLINDIHVLCRYVNLNIYNFTNRNLKHFALKRSIINVHKKYVRKKN